MTQTTVTWLYGLLPPLDWDEECEREASTGKRLLWNALVAIEQERRAGEDCLYRADGRLGEIMERLDAVERRLAQMTRRGTLEAERAQRRTLWAEQSALWGEANPLRNAVRRARAAEFRVLLERGMKRSRLQARRVVCGGGTTMRSVQISMSLWDASARARWYDRSQRQVPAMVG
jgi:hypothetical protein